MPYGWKIRSVFALTGQQTTYAAQKRPKINPHRPEQDFASGRRAEAPPEHDFWATHDEPNFMHSMYSLDVANGVWICCCRAENDLVHWHGPNPFKKRRCRECDHIFCKKKCASSEVLNPLNEEMSRDDCRLVNHQSPYAGRMCPECGQTHRATGKLRSCSCGAWPNEDWVTFLMGSPDKYRFNPSAAALKLRHERKMQAVERLTRHQQVELSPVEPPPCQLRRHNAVRRAVTRQPQPPQEVRMEPSRDHRQPQRLCDLSIDEFLEPARKPSKT
ncbi:hypothetical protein EK21DRAFT_85336 [Setomelanomma holmii]|uniref:Probable double zinc ribbon domain-containing protein n=1 Tax=Setomelanomma holmii TaxID=210430 RepID=A0A9P4HGW5_9PLEO|nr:hypothetical protein EK21DRAFT_85336 [Setomelanomma holmii]